MARKTLEDVLSLGSTTDPDHPIRRDCRGWDLRGVSLDYLSLTNSDFTGADLSGARCKSMSLMGAKFTGANLTGVDFSYSWLDGADFTGATLQDAVMFGSRLGQRSLTGEQLLGVKGLLPEWRGHRVPPDVWDQVLPEAPPGRKLVRWILSDLDCTLRQAVTVGERLLPEDPATQVLLLELLEDWEGTVEEAAATALPLRAA